MKVYMHSWIKITNFDKKPQHSTTYLIFSYTQSVQTS